MSGLKKVNFFGCSNLDKMMRKKKLRGKFRKEIIRIIFIGLNSLRMKICIRNNRIKKFDSIL